MPYFRERGYTPETIRYWNLGFSPSGWDAFYQKAKKLGYSEEFLISAGLIKQRDKDGSYYDLFRNRVIFPLLGVTGKVVGFAGRIMGKVDKAPKYVNSPETLLYKKSDFLFALFQAKGTIRKEDKAYLMEGYTDVMTLHQSGITNAVASSGTALTPGQIKLIKRFTDNTTIIYDGDTAGMKASMRGINLLLEGGLNVRVVPMPEGEDPDSYCKKLGPEGFKNYLDQNEQNFITFKAKLLLEGTQNDPLKKSDAIRDIIESVSLIGDPLKRDVLIKELEHIFDISSDLIYTELGKELRKVQQQEQKQLLEEVSQIINQIQPQDSLLRTVQLSDIYQEKALLRLLLLYGGKPFSEGKNVADFILDEYTKEEFFQFKHDETQYIIKHILEHYDEKVWLPIEFFTRSIDSKVVSFAAEVLSEDNKLSPAFESNLIYVKQQEDNFLQEIIDVFLHLRRTKIEEMIIEEQKKLNDPDDNPEEILEFIMYLNTKKLELAKQIGAVVTRY
jgi:DNA primase